MKKFVIKGLLVSSLVASGLMADGAFIGIEGGFTKSTLSDDAFDIKLKDAKPNIGLKMGYDFDSFRVYGAYNYNFKASDNFTYENSGVSVAFKTNWTSHQFLVGADFTPNVANDFKLAIGAYTGLAITKLELKANVDVPDSFPIEAKDSGRDNGYVFGGKLGGIYSVDENNQFEFGTKLGVTKFSDADMSEMGLYLGYTYKFN